MFQLLVCVDAVAQNPLIHHLSNILSGLLLSGTRQRLLQLVDSRVLKVHLQQIPEKIAVATPNIRIHIFLVESMLLCKFLVHETRNLQKEAARDCLQHEMAQSLQHFCSARKLHHLESHRLSCILHCLA